MAIVNIFSKRQNELNSKKPDCYNYDFFSKELRQQLAFVLTDFLGSFKEEYYSIRIKEEYNPYYDIIFDILCREYGVSSLSGSTLNSDNSNYGMRELYNHLMTASVNRCLDVFDVLFGFFKDGESVRFDEYSSSTCLSEAIEDFNQRLKEHSAGYRFENRFVFRIDSEFMHSEVTKPALEIISRREEYKPALDEFITAHNHYKENRLAECIVSCGKSLEALLKSIYLLNCWEIRGDTLQKLVAGAFEHDLIPSYLQNQFTEIRKMVSSGVGNIRNNAGAHGRSVDSNDVAVNLVQYSLNLTASNILFLTECNEAYLSNNS